MPLPIILYWPKYFIWKFCMKIAFTVSSTEQDLYREMKKKNTFWGYLIITAVSVLNLLKKQQFLTCYSLLQFIILKISINTCVECKISIRTISTIFFPVRVPVWRLTKSGDLYLSFFKIYFLVLNRLKKPKRSEQDKVIY